MTTLALYSNKGGVGKTAAAVNLAYLAARSGKNTLICDLDPQGAATYYLRVKPKVKAEPPKKVNISAGVMQGMLLLKTQPVYPPIAKAARVQGTVVLQATISKTGSIDNLRVVDGPPMLRQSAIDAVKTWRYRPYLLNNEPVEVDTQINVIFTLGG